VQLHATLLNTIYRKPRPKGNHGQRVPFDYLSVLSSPSFSSIRVGPPPDWLSSLNSDGKGKGKANRVKTLPVPVDLGTWDVDEVQICEMGSHGPEDEYVCVGKIQIA
jgi:activating signal cointegrator complex subunit 1